MGVPGLVLVHSPLVGPSSWAPVAAELRARGRVVAVPSLVTAVAAPPPLYQALAGAVIDALHEPESNAMVLVVHSGAGALVPSIVQAASSRVEAVVFVDATLPHPGRRWMDTVPVEMAAQVQGLTGPDGRLPPWHEWFPQEVFAQLVPDETARAMFTADVPRLPVRYLREVAPQLDRWRALPCSFVQLSEGYNDAAAEARRAGWPVARVDGHHLSGVTEPAVVASAIVAMADAL
jgi:hypothetical protein